MLTGLVGFCDLGFCGVVGFDLVLRLFLIVVLFVCFCPIVDEGKSGLVVWKGGVCPVGRTLLCFVVWLRCSPFAFASGVSVWVSGLDGVCVFVLSPLLRWPPSPQASRGLPCYVFGWFVEVVLWLVVVRLMRLSNVRFVS